jgi:Tol biopolymer transport system component
MAGNARILSWLVLGLVLGGVWVVEGQDLQINGKIVWNGGGIIKTMNADGSNQTSTGVSGRSPDWSPDGTKIVYSSGSNIYIMNADGSSPTELPTTAADDYPAWSPDGTKIAWESNAAGTQDIWVMDAADGNNKVNVSNNSAGHDWYPAWSPDGSKLVFASSRDGNTEIYVMNSDGSNQTRLTNNSATDHFPSWSPDGSKIAFGSNRDGNFDIYVMNADGSNQTRLTTNSASEQDNYWSPDGTKIVYSSDGVLYVMNADGSGQTSLGTAAAGDAGPSWATPYRIGSTSGAAISRTITVDNKGSATLTVSNITSSDGQFAVNPTSFSVSAGGSQNVIITFTPTSTGTKYSTLTFTSNDLTSSTAKLMVNATATGTAPADLEIVGKIAFVTERDGNPEIYLMGADGSNPTRVTNTGSSETVRDFSPDGTKILYYISGTTYSIGTDGTGNTQISTSAYANSWSPDGTQALFNSNRDGAWSIYKINADGSNVTRLTTGGSDLSCSWSPDGSKIAFERSVSQSEIYVMNADGSNVTQLTTTGGSDPKWSPDGSKIVFYQNNGSIPAIWVMNADGSGKTNLTPTASTGGWIPTWSPDGTRIAFHTNRDGVDEIYVINAADGSNATRLTINGVRDYFPAWAPFRYIGGANVGSSVSRTMTIKNRGGATLSVSNISSDNGQFTASPTNFSLAQGASQNVTVTFSPTSAGAKYATLTIASNDGDASNIKLTVNGTATGAPAISLGSTSVAVGNVNVGSSGQATFTVGNSGSASLSVTGITVGGTDASQFTVSPTSFTVASGASAQTVTVTFAPTSSGAKSASLSIVHNASGSPSSVSLSGTGAVPSISLSSTSVSVGNVSVGSSGQATFTVGNTGNATLSVTGITVGGTDGSQFTVSPSTFTVASGAVAQTVTVTFAPTSSGAKSASLSIAHNASGSPSAVSLSGTGAAPSISLSSSSVAVGNVNVGSSGQATFTVGNTGNAALSVTGITVGGTDASQFTVSPSSFSVASGAAAQTVTVTFAPTSSGAKSASLSIAHNASGSPSAVSLSGTGAAPSISLSSSSVAVGNVNVGSSGQATFTVGNSGSASLSVTGITVGGTDASQFTVSPSSFSVASGAAAQTVTVTFTPTSSGAKTASLSIAHNASGSPSTVSLTGTGAAAGISLSSSTAVLGSVNVGSSGTATFTVGNTGNATLSVTGITVGGTDVSQFTVSPSAFTVASGAAAQTVIVTFTPTSRGAKTASLSIAHNASGSPSSVTLSGTGVDVTAPATPATPTITLGNNQAVLTWTANSESDLSHYVVYRSTTSNFTPAGADSIARVNKPTATYTSTGLSAGTYYFKLAAVDSSGNKSSASAQATATLAPVIAVSLTSVPVGNSNVGVPVTGTFTVGNTGNAALSVTGIAVTGTDASQFAVSPSTFTVNAGAAAQTVTVTFTPTSRGAKSATLSIAHNASGSPSAVALTGTGLDVTAPATPSGLTATAGKSQATLNWTANSEADLSHYVIYRGITNNFTPVASDSVGRTNKPGTSFTNTGLSNGTFYYRIAAVDSAGNKSNFSAQSNAVAIRSDLVISPVSLAFGEVNVAASRSLPLGIKNAGNTDVTVSGLSDNSDQFSFTPSSLPVLDGGDSTTVTVTFTPSSPGTKSGVLTLSHNAGGSPTTTQVQLSGLGKDVTPPAAPSTPVATPGDGTVALNWSANSESDLSHYVVYRSTTSNFTPAGSDSVARVNRPSTLANISAPDPGTYYFKLAAVDSAGNKSPFSVQASAALQRLLTVTPQSVNFDSVSVGLSETRPVRLRNTGNMSLSVSSITDNSDQYSFLPAIPPALTLVPGDSTVVNVTYAPTAQVNHNASLTITSNASPPTTTVSLTGRGSKPPVLIPQPSALEFGDVLLSSRNTTRTLTLTNPGAAARIDSITSNDTTFVVVSPQLPQNIASKGSVSVTVRFTPPIGSVQARTAVLRVSSSVGRVEVPMSGRGTWIGFNVQPDTVKFGRVKPGETGIQKFAVINPGNLTLDISATRIDNAVFDAQPRSFRVPEGGRQEVSVTFKPILAKGEVGLLTLSGNADSVKTVILLGEGSQGAIAEVNPPSLIFANARVEASRTERLSLRNGGGDTLRVRELGGLQPPFSVASPLPGPLSGTATSPIEIRFAPTAKGIFNDTLLVVSNAETRQVPVSGRGTRGELTVSPERLVFDPVPAGGTGEATLILTNTGDDTLVVSNILSSKPQRFAVSTTQLVLPPNKAESVTVRFSPAEAEQDSADLSITSNVGSRTIRAAGTLGQGPTVELTLDPAEFGKVSLNRPKTLTATIANRTTGSVAVQELLVSPAGGPVQLQLGAVTLPRTLRRGESFSVRLLYTPVAVEPLNAALVVRGQGFEKTAVLLGAGVEGGLLAFDPPDTLRILDAAVSTTKADTVELRNDGGDTVHVEQVRVIPATIFRLAQNPGRFVLAPGETRLIPVTVRPRTEEPVLARLVVSSDAPSSPDTLILLARPPEQLPKIALNPADTLRFGTAGQGQDDIKPLTIRNEGQGELRVSLESERPAEFAPERDTLIVQAGQSRQVQVRFRPTQGGTRTARLTVRSNDRQQETLLLTMRGLSGSLRFEPVSLDFGEVVIGAQKDTTVFLVNETADAGTFRLEILGIGFTANPSRTIAVDAGQRQPIRISFSPVIAGPFSATLQIVDRNLSLPLSGSGVDVVIRPPSGLRAAVEGSRVNLSWNANTEPGLSHYVVYGNLQDNFEPTRADSIGRASRSSPRLTHTPQGGGSFYYRVVAVDNAGNRSEPSETVAVQLALAPTVSDAVLPFGEVGVGVPKTLSVLVSNPGPGTMSISNIAVTGRDNNQFRPARRTETIPAGESKSIEVTFTPNSAGVKTAVLNITHDKGAPLTVNLSGTGLAAALQVSLSSLDFGSQTLGTTGTQELTLSNTGGSALQVTLALGGSGASQFKFTGSRQQSIPARGSVVVSVSFAPTSAGAKSATLTITPGTGSPVRVSLRGSGEAVALQVAPSSLDFGTQTVSSTGTQELTLSNGTASALQVTLALSGADQGQFRLSGSRQQSIPARGSAVVSVSFAPTSAGAKSATLTVTPSAGSPVRVSLRGSGEAVALQVSSTSLDFGSQTVSSTSSQTLTLSNASGNALSVTLALGGTGASQFRFSGSRQQSIPARGSAVVSVSFAPTSAGAKSATLTITPGTGNPVRVSLRGSGQAATQAQLQVSPQSLSLANTEVGKTSAAKTLQITTTSRTEVQVALSQEGAHAGDFAVTPLQGTVSSSRPLSISVTFTPTAAGSRSATLVVTPASGTPLRVSLRGTATQPVAAPLRPVPTAVDFQTAQVGSSTPRNIRLVNSSNTALSLRLELTGADRSHFRLRASQVQAPGSREGTATVFFEPRSIGAKRATLVIRPASGNAFSQIEVPLSGNAVAASGLSAAGAGEESAKPVAPLQAVLGDNYPNPFNAQTLIQYQLPEAQAVNLEIYDLLGRKVRTLVSGGQGAGVYLVVWDGLDETGNAVASGIYLYRLETGVAVQVRRMTLLR